MTRPHLKGGPSEQVTNYSSETPLCNIVTEGKEPGVWYPDDVEKNANLDKKMRYSWSDYLMFAALGLYGIFMMWWTEMWPFS